VLWTDRGGGGRTHERHDAVRDVEAGLAGLQEVFSDMAVLAEGHGEMLDNIEAQVRWTGRV
jgi:t-SNARE complex subunit (syntaxin)